MLRRRTPKPTHSYVIYLQYTNNPQEPPPSIKLMNTAHYTFAIHSILPTSHIFSLRAQKNTQKNILTRRRAANHFRNPLLCKLSAGRREDPTLCRTSHAIVVLAETHHATRRATTCARRRQINIIMALRHGGWVSHSGIYQFVFFFWFVEELLFWPNVCAHMVWA